MSLQQKFKAATKKQDLNVRNNRTTLGASVRAILWNTIQPLK